jgi:hypothetical protein
MKMTRREFLVWLGGTVCLGLLGWLVGRRLQVPPEPVPEAPFEPPMFAVRPKHILNGMSFQVDRAKRTVLANMESGDSAWESHGEDKFIVPGAAFPLDLSPDGELWVANIGRKRLEQLDPATGRFIASWEPREAFGGCCNPVRFAALPGGRFVTMEKGVRRACVYLPSGELERVITDRLSDSEFNYYLGRDTSGAVHLYDTGTKQHWEVS